ncbi:hypothetical protein EB796_010243 [Bugula neritina]|uniref:Uncharacterized protein n=1 Tax=Bugula neritina TaxID=10212 RepID=A0A7J7K1H4_BUGNE|nr:hypothetical protein EB796_010243 [Bugula neritina]
MATTAVIIGAGSRGSCYPQYALLAPDKMKIVGVAEPVDIRRDKFEAQYNIPKKMVFKTWQELSREKRLADVAIITTQDKMHKEPAIKLAEKGYHILLEKPMAVTYQDCIEIVEAVKKHGVMFGVCHVLRYYPQYLKIRELIQSGVIGEVCNIQHTEPVGYWHFAHSYVRGNWRKEQESSCSLLAKCCHDLDLITYWVGEENKCTKISSFGSLMHFTPDHKPKGAADRCLDCSVHEDCAFSAQKIYLDRAKRGSFHWPVSVVTNTNDIEDLVKELKAGPYGRCVYNCDNDVMSNQVVNMQFKNGATATLSMVAFTKRVCARQTVISGSKGEISCDFFGPVTVFDFLSGNTTEHKVGASFHGPLGGHGGADFHIITTFIDAIRANDQSKILAGPDETLYSHLLVFAAERSRVENRVVDLEVENAF